MLNLANCSVGELIRRLWRVRYMLEREFFCSQQTLFARLMTIWIPLMHLCIAIQYWKQFSQQNVSQPLD